MFDGRQSFSAQEAVFGHKSKPVRSCPTPDGWPLFGPMEIGDVFLSLSFMDKVEALSAGHKPPYPSQRQSGCKGVTHRSL